MVEFVPHLCCMCMFASITCTIHGYGDNKDETKMISCWYFHAINIIFSYVLKCDWTHCDYDCDCVWLLVAQVALLIQNFSWFRYHTWYKIYLIWIGYHVWYILLVGLGPRLVCHIKQLAWVPRLVQGLYRFDWISFLVHM